MVAFMLTVINTVEENHPLYGILLHLKSKGHPEGWPVYGRVRPTSARYLALLNAGEDHHPDYHQQEQCCKGSHGTQDTGTAHNRF